jgi:hypothetical protein
MIFYGNGVVWDAEKKRILCEFVDGIYITDDDREIKILMGLDYQYKVIGTPEIKEVEGETVKEEGEVVEPIEVSTNPRARKRKNYKCEENDSN